MSAYAALVREEDSPHVPKAPSRTFLAVLGALAEAGVGRVGDLSRRAGVDQPAASRVLTRMRRLGIATGRTETPAEHAGHGGKPCRFYTITTSGVDLAKALAAAERGA